MLNLKQFKTLVKSTLDIIQLTGDTAINLVTGTCLQESSLIYLYQTNGPALGVAQIEPATYNDICTRIQMHLAVYKKCLTLLNMPSFPADANALVGNMTLSIIICRLKYWLDPAPLPANNAASLAAEYKRVYNTTLGAATLAQAEISFTLAINTQI